MRAGNAEVAARKPTASPCVSNGRDILPDAWGSDISSSLTDAGRRRPKRGRDAAHRRRSLQT
jgi:hypothetical protein